MRGTENKRILQTLKSRVSSRSITSSLQYDTIRYDTRYYFNVRSKADIGLSQLNLLHGTNNKKVGKKKN